MAREAKSLKPPSPEQFSKELLSSLPSLKEPKARLSVLLAEYVEQHSMLQAEWQATQRKPDLEDLVVTPPDLNDMEELLHRWHADVLEDMLRLDAEPELKLHWDTLCQEVIASGKPFGGLAHSVAEYALHRLLRRQGQMRLQRLSLHAIYQGSSFKDRHMQKRRNSGATTSPAQRALHAIDSELEFGTQRLRRIRDHLCGSQDCLHSMTGPRDAASFMSSSAWRGAAIVLVRQMLLEEVATKDLRHFLLQLQYLGFASRTKIWRKSLEHRAVMEIASEGSSGGRHRVIQSNLAPLLSVPLGPTNRKKLERTLQEMAQGFSLGHLSMQPDRGKTFAHQAALCFSDIFEKQQQKWQFRAYPIQSCIGVSDLQSSMEDGCFLRPSPWAEQLPWKPNLDEEFEEQRMLLDASYARRSTPLRVGALNHSLSTAHRSKPTYARQLLDQAAALLGPDPTMKGIVEVPGGGCALVDSLLGNELKTLQLADCTLAARRCNEKAEEPVGGPGAAEFATQDQAQDKMPQHLLRAYYLLRFLQSRSCRWRLLAVLNFFRFVQRRLAIASAVLTTELDEGKGSSFIGRESDPSQRVEEKAQDKYWDISSRGLSRILRHCSLPFTDDPPTAGDFDPLKLDRETYTSHDEDTFIIKDSFGRQVLHEAALNDLDCLELEMLKIGSYFIHKYEATRSDEREIAAVDRCAVLYDLLASEVWFHTEKQHLVEVYLNIFEDTTDPLEQRILAQRMIDVMALRPRLDLQEPYFVEAYSASILLLRSRSALLKELQQHQVSCEVSASKRATSKTAERSFGRSAGSSGGFNAAATPGSSLRSKQGMLMPGLDGGLAHPQEGNTLSGGIATARREGEIMCADGDKILGHNTCCLVWKAELILESVHKDLAQHFQTPPVASTQLERACYVVAMEKWSQQQEPFFQSELPPHEDPELHLTLLQELAKRLVGIEQQDRQRWRQGGPTFVGEEFGKAQAVPSSPVSKYSSWVESISMNDMMTHSFEEVASAAADPSLTLQASYQHALGCLLAQLVEFLELRGRLQDTAVEVQHLQRALKEQAMDFGSSLLPLRNISGEDANALRGNQLTAALVTKSMGSLQASTSDALLMQCSRQKLQEVQQMLQHELAFRCLALACVQQNALLLDPQVRSKELSDISTIGLSRDAVASDGGLGVMRRLRDSLEISGHDKNHPHAKQPDQDVLASVSNSAEVSKMSGTEDKGAAIMDMSRYAQYLQQPARYLEPVIAVLSRIWAEMDSMREHRLLRFKLLRCSSLMALRASCDLVTGLQVGQTSNELARMAMLLPKSLTPFTYGDRVKPLVERDGQVTNIFSLPNTFDSLQLRALPPREFGPLAEILADRAIEKTEESTFEEELKEHLDLNINGPAIVALQVLNAVAQLFALRYAICMLEADPVCLLEAQRNRFPSIDLEQLFRAHAHSVQERSGDPVEQSKSKPVLSSEEEEIDTGDLSRAGPAYEAIEDLCADIARLVARLHALGPENCRKSTKVLEVLQTEIRSAQRCLAAVLRRSTQRLQERGEANEAYALRQWSSLLEETNSLPPGDPPRPWFLELSPTTHGSLPAVEPCSKESKKIQESQEPCWNQQIHLHKATIPAIARLHEDALSYISHLHPSLVDWRQELPDLVVAMQSHFVGAAFPKKRRASPRIVRLPWQMPVLPSSRLLRLPLSLNSARRQQLSRARSDLAERCQALHWIYGIEQDSNYAAYAESEMFGLMLLRDRLQEVLGAGHLGWTKLPSDAEGLALLHAELAATIPKEEPAEPIEISGALELEPNAVRSEIAAIRKQLAALVPASAQLIWSTATERLSEEFSALVALQFRLQSVSSSNVTRTAPVPEIVSSMSRKNEDVALLTGGPFAAKLDGLQPIAELLTKSTFVRMDNNPDGEAAHVLKELQINACLEDLVFGLWSWGRLMSKNRERRTQEILGFLDHLRNVLKFRGAAVEVQTIDEGHVLVTTPELDWLEATKESMKEKKESMEAQFRADVAARAVRMVFEVDRVHRCQRNLKAAAGELQSRLQGEVMDQVRSTVSNFAGALSAEDGRFRESHGISGEVLQRQLRDLREHVTSELSALAAKNQVVQFKASQPRQVPGLETLLPEKDTGGIDFQTLVGGMEEEENQDDGFRSPMKRRHSQNNVARRNSEVYSHVKPSVLTVSDGMYGKLAEVASRREVYDLQMELKNLRDRQLLERIFHRFKCEAMRQHFKRKVQEQEATLESNSSLLGQFAEISRAEDAAANDFIRGAQEVSDAEKRTEELGPLTQSNAEQKRRLAKWKKNKSKQLYHMKKGVRDHEMAGTMDVASLLQDIQSKQELVKMLQQGQREFDDEVVRATEENAVETAQVRAAMIKQRQVKDDTFKELQRLRAEMQRPDGAKNVEYWRSKVMEIRQEMKSLEEENAKLRVLLSMREHPKED